MNTPNQEDKYWLGTDNLERGNPWLTPASIAYLEPKLSKQTTVLEFGMGGSTIFFARRCQSVVSVDDKLVWVDKVTAKLKDDALTNVQLQHCRRERSMIRFIKKLSAERRRFDVILVDTGAKCDAGKICEAVEPLLVPQGLLVIDNYYGHHASFVSFLVKPGWECLDFNDPHWYGSGTRIAVKPSSAE